MPRLAADEENGDDDDDDDDDRRLGMVWIVDGGVCSVDRVGRRQRRDGVLHWIVSAADAGVGD